MAAGACTILAAASVPGARAADAGQSATARASEFGVGPGGHDVAERERDGEGQAALAEGEEFAVGGDRTGAKGNSLDRCGRQHRDRCCGQAPSVYVYQQGIGNNEPVLSIRGTRGLETAQTLDGVPMQDLLNGGTGAYLQNNIGGYFNLDQIDGVSIYPGVAYPDKGTFGTIGGTVAYASKRPSNDFYLDVFGSVGSFQTIQ